MDRKMKGRRLTLIYRTFPVMVGGPIKYLPVFTWAYVSFYQSITLDKTSTTVVCWHLKVKDTEKVSV